MPEDRLKADIFFATRVESVASLFGFIAVLPVVAVVVTVVARGEDIVAVVVGRLLFSAFSSSSSSLLE